MLDFTLKIMFILNFIILHYLVLLPCYLVHKSTSIYQRLNDIFVLLGKREAVGKLGKRGVLWYMVHRNVLKKRAFDNNSVMNAKNTTPTIIVRFKYQYITMGTFSPI